MSRAVTRQMAQIRAALISGDAQAALAAIDDLMRVAARAGLDEEARDRLEPALAELRALAQASLTGAQQAADQIRAIVQAARSLQTYDSLGRRNIMPTRATAPQRF
ncbi:hypothetical protein [Paracoccus liaowanqingii]|uniref:hypothetical protein n=1 Tax=Paracoccus liaowanqingii TaxID=2560053 RepID=UPI00143D4818|nr:hypothetical protein [Paracoccus liaowanqingii]